MAGSRRVKILIPAAGESRRFREAGFSLPKPFLPVEWGGVVKTMLEHVVDCVPPEYEIVVGVRVPRRLNRGVAVAVRDTGGQADTVRQMLGHVDAADAVMTMDCDTLVPFNVAEFAATLSTYRAAVCVADIGHADMSRVDCVPNPSVFVERGAISRWGVVSVRGFDSAGVLSEVLEEVVEEHARSGTEPYLSHALNRYPGVKYAHVINTFHDWGTPDKLRISGARIVTEEM